MSYNLDGFDPTEDWDLFDGRDTIDPTYEHRDPVTNTYGTPFIIPALFRGGAESTRPIGDGETAINESVVHVPSASFAAVPHRGDRITRFSQGGDPISYWIVQEVNDQTLGTRYRLTTTQSLE